MEEQANYNKRKSVPQLVKDCHYWITMMRKQENVQVHDHIIIILLHCYISKKIQAHLRKRK